MSNRNERRPALPLLCLIVFLDLLGFGILIPLQTFYADYFHASKTQVTTLMGIYSVAQFVFATLWGRLSDRHGRRPVLALSQASSVISYLMMAAAGNFWMLFAARVISGMAAANISAAMAYGADISTTKDRHKTMGMLGATIGMGFVLGPVIGALGAQWGEAMGGGKLVFVVPSLIAAAMSLLALLGVLFMLPESLPAGDRTGAKRSHFPLAGLGAYLGNTQISISLAIRLLATIAFATMELTFGLLLKDRFGFGVRQTGYVFGALGVAAVITQGGLVRKLAPKLGEPRLVLIGAILLAASLAAISHVGGLGLFMTIAPFIAVGAGLLQPSLDSHLSKSSPTGEFGGVLGLGQGMSSLGRALPFWLAGYLYGLETGGPYAAYWFAAALAAACAALAFRLRRVG